MKKIILLLLLASLCLAPSYIDQLTADFNAGTHTNTNASNNSLVLNGTIGNISLSGTFLSQTFLLGSNPTATIAWTYTSASGTSILVSTRSGPNATPDGLWSSYSSSYTDPTGNNVSSPIDEYYQYRVQLATTNQNVTPAIFTVTLTYTEGGPEIIPNSTLNSDLDGNLTSAYPFFVNINDTVSLSNVSLRYRYNSSASYTPYYPMNFSNNRYHFLIPANGTNWSANAGQTLQMNVYVINNRNLTDNQTFNDTVETVNRAPLLNTISNTTATEGTPKVIFMSGFDPDGDAVTFGASVGTVTSISSTSAQTTWTPSNLETGLVTVTLNISDGSLATAQNITVNVTDVNDAPVMSAITDQSGHYGDRIIFRIQVTDNDTNANLTYTVEPAIFDVENISNSSNNNSYLYFAQADFYALDDHKGNTSLTFTVSDQTATDSQNATLTITYCGDGVCQSVENSTACRADCQAVQFPSYVAVEIPERVCVNQSMVFTTYNASSRFVCYKEGKTHEGAAYCKPIDDVSIEVYHLDKIKRTSITTLTTNSQGNITFTPAKTGEYSITATKEDFIGHTQIMVVNDCSEDIQLVTKVVEAKKPQITAEQRERDLNVRTELPQLTAEETSLLSIIIWYILIPLLLAGLTYTGSAYYDLHKDTDPRILAMRLKYYEWVESHYPKIEPYITRIKEIFGPIMKPPALFVYHKILTPIGHSLKPLWDTFLRLVQR